ncbi:hypothetical protein [Nocardia sp. NPDC059228]|uniref:hypothetical protein n=1 Tax=Nocardia sp. NPDC059228 TaxID=3346777 RepID=UPI0036900014
MKHEFLSDEWLSAVTALHARSPEVEIPDQVRQLAVNFEITGCRWGVRRLHLDGTVDLRPGTLDQPRTVVTMTYAAARELFVNADIAAALEAFMIGDMDVEGEIAPLVEMQQTVAVLTANQAAFHDQIVALTAEPGDDAPL